MREWFCRFKCLWLGSSCKVKTPVYDSMIRQLREIHEGIQDVRKRIVSDKQLLLKELQKKDIIMQAMMEKLPDMLWFKDVNGKYVYANKAVKDGLLLDNNPEGKTDVELALNAKAKFGERNHTFGEVCDNSDIDVLEHEYTSKRYVESGKVKGKMLHLEVNKSIVKLDDGEVLGVVGSGRDITEYREKLIQSGKDVDVFKENEFKNKDV